ncbi:hypothetical protein PR048_027220 [Dryococelus australis]|uniref:HTH CENPB-type domain-containing protein n=1 Tax=Dryococelus australis TaxID=614101 RepID=A0ABQ9GF30_9NEOP|nr:hypothetical protein PR048_027220 [Dryococelus australis]
MDAWRRIGWNMKMKKLQGADHEGVEKALLAWFNQFRGQNMLIKGPMIQGKANLFALMLKVECSTGWLDRFKKQNGITWHKIVGESTAVPCGMGWEGSKERLTVLLCANVDGSDKVMSFVAWITGDLFTKCQHPQLEGRSFSHMLVHDMVVCIDINHPQRKGDVLRTIQVICTSWDAVKPKHITNCFRHAQFVVGEPKQITEEPDDDDDNTTTTLTVCLLKTTVEAKLGDKPASPQPGTSAEPQLGILHDVLSSRALLISIEVWDRLAPSVAYEDYLAIDDDMPAWEALDDEDLISGHKESIDEEWEGEEDEVPKLTREGMLEVIKMLTNSMLCSDADSEVWASLVHLKKWVVTSYGKKKQASITQYSKK